MYKGEEKKEKKLKDDTLITMTSQNTYKFEKGKIVNSFNTSTPQNIALRKPSDSPL